MFMAYEESKSAKIPEETHVREKEKQEEREKGVTGVNGEKRRSGGR